MNHTPPKEEGFAYIAAILVVVALGGLALAVMRMNATQQVTGAMDLQSAHADQAARAGLEWGLYQALVVENGCAVPVNRTISFAGVAGFRSTVTCVRTPFNEGESDTATGTPVLKYLYRVDAVACNGSAACPDDGAAVTQGYVERKRSATACAMADRKPCY